MKHKPLNLYIGELSSGVIYESGMAVIAAKDEQDARHTWDTSTDGYLHIDGELTLIGTTTLYDQPCVVKQVYGD